jgi:hypothetical protein
MGDVVSWLSGNVSTLVLLVGFIGLIAYVFYLRFRMAVSKARFALAALAAMVSCVFALMTVLSGPIPIQIFNATILGLNRILGTAFTPVATGEGGWLEAGLAFIATLFALSLIYRFSIGTIRSWEGPITVNVNELAKREYDNNIIMLALAELKTILRAGTDPIASDVAVNWEQRQSEAPPAPQWPMLARSLFETAFSEMSFGESSWRDRAQAWIGQLHLSQPNQEDAVPIVVFVFGEIPSPDSIRSRIQQFEADGATVSGSKLFAVFSEENTDFPETIDLPGWKVEVWSRNSLLRKGLNLTSYARDLIRRFDSDPLGGTTATLKNTFVEAHVMKAGSTTRVALRQVLLEWVVDSRRRHLAFTGEYGQGKSTAMLEFCSRWAKRYLSSDADAERVPLLIELRGQSPGETDPLAFLSAWAGRYGLPPKQLFNLIKAGDAILIFEGFDELRNAGRAYDRHEHFNALWRFAYPGTKLVFTGRPNFFLDEKEKNRTLRADLLKGAAGNAYTEVWGLDRLTEHEIRQVLNGFDPSLAVSIMEAARAHPSFLDIISRPSMLPVVATIWDKIEDLQQQGGTVTSAILLENYLQAIYARKEDEIERDKRVYGSPEGASYLLLPREVREVFTLAIVCKMVSVDARNTISRRVLDNVIAHLFEEVFRIFQKQGVNPHIARRVRDFEERYKDESKSDRIERIAMR